MHELILKINLLDGLSKQKVIAYVEELLGKQKEMCPLLMWKRISRNY